MAAKLQSSIVLLALTVACLVGGAGCASFQTEHSEMDKVHAAKVERVIERSDNSLERVTTRRQIASP